MEEVSPEIPKTGVSSFITSLTRNLTFLFLCRWSPCCLHPLSRLLLGTEDKYLCAHYLGCEVKEYLILDFLGDNVDQMLKLVMVDQGGEEVRERAKAMKGVMKIAWMRYLQRLC